MKFPFPIETSRVAVANLVVFHIILKQLRAARARYCYHESDVIILLVLAAKMTVEVL